MGVHTFMLKVFGGKLINSDMRGCMEWDWGGGILINLPPECKHYEYKDLYIAWFAVPNT